MAKYAADLKSRYEHFVINTPEKASQVESLARILSYIIPAGVNNSNIVAELLYSTSNLLVLLNDAILRTARGVTLTVPQAKLRGWMAVIDCAEVFLEMAAGQLGGEPLRWLIIASIQLLKAAIRLFLLLKHDSGMQCSPMLPPLDRSKNITGTPRLSNPVMETIVSETKRSNTYTLPRSNRLIRTLASAPAMSERTWKPLKHGTSSCEGDSDELMDRPSRLSGSHIAGEILHISRPLVHLLSTFVCGRSSWKPWLLAGVTDVSSVALSSDARHLNTREKSEVRRRTLLLLLYLLRSPMYERATRDKLMRGLTIIANEVPVFGMLARPCISYLPLWQQIYAYVWTT